MEFKEYKSKGISEARIVTEHDIEHFKGYGCIPTEFEGYLVRIMDIDIKNGCPKIGDMIIRHPQVHEEQYLVDGRMFNELFEEI